ncbi:MAG TPA: hypothetical protein PLN31_20460 [Azoarcus taiwanensis]|nr:hypothetical protein [Azoarcus taiwanensis]
MIDLWESLEQAVKREWPEGRSAGAAARQLVYYLEPAPTLKKLIEELLAEANRRAFDRSMILRAIDVVAPDDAPRIRRESYIRNNPNATIAGAGAGDN